MRTLLILLLLCPSVVAQCPGGKCPVPQRIVHSMPVQRVIHSAPVQVFAPNFAPQVVAPNFAPTVRVATRTASYSYSGTKWTYPGEISNHLTSAAHVNELVQRGININGMSRREMEALHSTLHNERSVPMTAAKRTTYRQRTFRVYRR